MKRANELIHISDKRQRSGNLEDSKDRVSSEETDSADDTSLSILGITLSREQLFQLAFEVVNNPNEQKFRLTLLDKLPLETHKPENLQSCKPCHDASSPAVSSDEIRNLEDIIHVEKLAERLMELIEPFTNIGTPDALHLRPESYQKVFISNLAKDFTLLKLAVKKILKIKFTEKLLRKAKKKIKLSLMAIEEQIKNLEDFRPVTYEKPQKPVLRDVSTDADAMCMKARDMVNIITYLKCKNPKDDEIKLFVRYFCGQTVDMLENLVDSVVEFDESIERRIEIESQARASYILIIDAQLVLSDLMNSVLEIKHGFGTRMTG